MISVERTLVRSCVESNKMNRKTATTERREKQSVRFEILTVVNITIRLPAYYTSEFRKLDTNVNK
jgi:hypothetical protein